MFFDVYTVCTFEFLNFRQNNNLKFSHFMISRKKMDTKA